MAKGAQDWIQRTDILLQTLSEIIQRPRLGDPAIVDVSGAVAANSDNLVASITGAGIAFSLFFYATSTGVIDNDYFKYVVDGTTVSLPTFKTFYDNNFTMGVPTQAFGSCYDILNFAFAGGSFEQWTWNTSFLLYYVETHGRNPVATIKWRYSLF